MYKLGHHDFRRRGSDGRIIPVGVRKGCRFSVQEDINAAEAAYDGEDLGICDPSNNSGASDSSVEQEMGAIVDWLNSHPETHDMAEFDGIVAALKALYSC